MERTIVHPDGRDEEIVTRQTAVTIIILCSYCVQIHATAAPQNDTVDDSIELRA
jgi:hypothetical protein